MGGTPQSSSHLALLCDSVERGVTQLVADARLSITRNFFNVLMLMLMIIDGGRSKSADEPAVDDEAIAEADAATADADDPLSEAADDRATETVEDDPNRVNSGDAVVEAPAGRIHHLDEHRSTPTNSTEPVKP